jgi:signal transduction histidine kinase
MAPGGLEGGGLGMSSMRERAGEMGGELILRSEVNSGTTVEVVVPLTGGGNV